MISLHFWNKGDGEEALKFLENQYQLMEFRCSYNLNKVEEEVGENQIIESELPEEVEKEVKEPTKEVIKVKEEESVPEKISEQPIVEKPVVATEQV